MRHIIMVPLPISRIPFISTSVLLLYCSTVMVCTSVSAHAQSPTDRQNLFIPPSLTVGVTGDPSFRKVLYNNFGTNGALDSLNGLMGEELRFLSGSTLAIQPFLPLIFFDRNSSRIPDRYQQFTSQDQTDTYRESESVSILDAQSRYSNVMLPKYYELLNIVGSRMRQNPSAHIDLQGGFSTETGEDSQLGRERALAVRHYLRDIWTIDTGRITILPSLQFAHPADNQMVQDEARRVLITSRDSILSSLIEYQMFAGRSGPILLSFTIVPHLVGEHARSITLLMEQEDRIVGRASIPVSPDSLTYQMYGYWYYLDVIRQNNEPLIFQALVESTTGESRVSNTVEIPIELVDVVGDREHPVRLYSTLNAVSQVVGYEPRAHSLSDWQKESFEEVLERIEEIVERTGDSIDIDIKANIDAGELPDRTDAEIENDLSATSFTRTTLVELMKQHSLEVAIYPFSSTVLVDADQMRGLFQAFDRPEDLISGNFTEIVRQEVRRTSGRRIDLAEGTRVLLTSLVRDRQEGVARMIQERFDSSQVHAGYSYSVPPNQITFMNRPEERYLNRSVSLNIMKRQSFDLASLSRDSMYITSSVPPDYVSPEYAAVMKEIEEKKAAERDDQLLLEDRLERERLPNFRREEYEDHPALFNPERRRVDHDRSPLPLIGSRWETHSTDVESRLTFTLQVNTDSAWYRYNDFYTPTSYGSLNRDSVVLMGTWQREALTLLPLLFFETGSSRIPERYHQFTERLQRQEYSEEEEVNGVGRPGEQGRSLQKYYELLDIVGSRMNRYPTTSIRLQGGYSEEPGETRNVADARAAAVRDYLQDIWGINSSRITILPSELKVASKENRMLQEEARRVEIVSDDYELTTPVTYRSIRTEYPFINFRFHFKTTLPNEQVDSVLIRISDGERLLGMGAFTSEFLGDGKGDISSDWLPPYALQTGPGELLIEGAIRTVDGTLYVAEPVIMPVVVDRYRRNVDQASDLPYDYSDSAWWHTSYTVPGFLPAETTFSAWQEVQIEGLTKEIQKGLESSGRKGTITIASECDAAELVGDGFEKMIADAFEVRRVREEWFQQIDAPFPPIPLNAVAATEEHEDQTLSIDPEGKLYRALVGPRIDTLDSLYLMLTDPLPGFSLAPELARRYHQIQRERCRTAETVLNTGIGPEYVESILYYPAQMGGSYLSQFLYPEERFYHRSLVITVEDVSRGIDLDF